MLQVYANANVHVLAHTHTYRVELRQWGSVRGNLRAAEKQMSETAAKSGRAAK